MRKAHPGRRYALDRALLCASVGITSAHVAAQTRPDPAITDPDSIIITARRQKEPLERAGIPASALSGKEVVESGTIYVDRLGEHFPSVTVQPSATGNLIFIRGVGNSTLQPNSDPRLPTSMTASSSDARSERCRSCSTSTGSRSSKGPQGCFTGAMRRADRSTSNRAARLRRTVHVGGSELRKRRRNARRGGHQSADQRRVCGSRCRRGFRQARRADGLSGRTEPQSIRAQVKTRIGTGRQCVCPPTTIISAVSGWAPAMSATTCLIAPLVPRLHSVRTVPFGRHLFGGQPGLSADDFPADGGTQARCDRFQAASGQSILWRACEDRQ